MSTGWENPGPARQVIIAGTQGELLVYYPKPGLGNLVVCIAGQAGTDAYGNTFQQGLTIFSKNGSYANPFQLFEAGTTKGLEIVSAAGAARLIGTTGISSVSLEAPTVLLGASGFPTGNVVRVNQNFCVGQGVPGGSYYEELETNTQTFASSTAAAACTNLSLLKSNSDYGTAFNTATGTWTCPADGSYTFSFTFGFAAWVAASRLICGITKNGAGVVNYMAKYDNPDNSGCHSLSIERYCVASPTPDTVNFRVAQATGANQTLVQDERSRITVRRNF